MKRKIVFLRIGVPITCFGLGLWQLYRLKWKKHIINELNDCLKQTDEYSLVNTTVYRPYVKYRLEGKEFNIQESIVIGPRGFRQIDSPFSFMIISSIQLSDGRRMLLNRGLIPFIEKNSSNNNSDRDSMSSNQLDKLKENKNEKGDYLVILDTTDEKKSIFRQENYPQYNKWYRKDIEEISKHLHTSPSMFKVISAKNEGGDSSIKIPTPNVEISNRHLEYVFTWFGIGIGTILLSFS